MTYQLTEGQFWKLVAKQRQTDQLRQALAVVEADGRRLWDAIASEYGFDPKKQYTFNEETCEISEVTGAP